MKELLILVDKAGKKKKNLVSYLGQNLGGKAKVTLGRFSDLIFEIERKNVRVRLDGRNIADFDLIYFRRAGSDLLSLAGSLAICLDYLKIEYIDSAFCKIGPAGSKLTSLIKLSLAGLPVMPSFFCRRDKIEDQIEYIVSKFGFPLVAKDLSRQRGKGVFLLKKREDFDFLKKVAPKDQFLFQKFYSNEEEYRLVVLGDKAAVYYRKIRKNSKEFRSNTALGAEEEFLDVKQAPKQMKQIAVKAAKVLGLEITGVDILIDSRTGKRWLLEANRSPGFTEPPLSPELSALASFFATKLGVKKSR